MFWKLSTINIPHEIPMSFANLMSPIPVADTSPYFYVQFPSPIEEIALINPFSMTELQAHEFENLLR